MGKYTGGINRSFSGKTGTVVGSRWRKINYMRGVGRRSTKKASDDQVTQRNKFSMMSDFLERIREIIDRGLSSIDNGHQTAYNYAFGYNLKWAFKTTGEGYEIDYSRILLSKGRLPKASDVKVTLEADNKLHIRWNTAIRSSIVSGEDVLSCCYCCPELKQYMSFQGVKRKDGEVLSILSDPGQYHDWHVLLFFTSPDGISGPTFYIKATGLTTEAGSETAVAHTASNSTGLQ